MSNILILSLYIPAYKGGGPIKSIESICNAINKTSNITVLSPSKDIDGTFINYNEYWTNKVNVVNLIVKDNPSIFWLYQQVKKHKIDIIYLNSFFDFKNLLLCLLLKIIYKYNLILSPRGQLNHGALIIKKRVKLIYIYFFKLFLSRFIKIYHSTCNSETKEIIKYLNVKSHRIITIGNIRNIEIKKKYFTISNKKNGNLNIVFYSRIVPKKNLLGAIKVLNMLNNNINIDIYGTLEDKVYWKKCLEEITKGPLSIKYTYKGSLKPELIIETLSKYDLMFFPTLGENFGHVILEAFYSGIPIIISNYTPFTEKIIKYNIGIVVDIENKQNLSEAIKMFYNMSEIDMINYKSRILNYLNDLIFETESLKIEYIKLFK